MIVAILGAGVMGETLLSGLVRSGRPPEQLLIAERRQDRADELRERYGVGVVGNADAAAKADTLLLVVKPQDVPDLLTEIAPVVRSGQLVVLTSPPASPRRSSSPGCRTRPSWSG